jgi:hypothetical protein
MTASFRLTIRALPVAFAALLPAAALHAQTASQPAQNSTQAPPVSNDTIGPRERRDFSLGKPATRTPPTVVTTVPSTNPPRTSTQQSPAAPQRQPLPSQAAPTGPLSSPPPSTTQPQPQPQPQQQPRSATGSPPLESSSSVTFQLPSAASPGESPQAGDGATSSLGSQPALVPVTPPESASMPLNSGPPMWPWLVAAVLAGVGVLYYGKRQRLRRATAGDAVPLAPPPEPLARTAAPRPPPVRPVAAPPPEKPASREIPGLIVSTRLRPQLDIQFIPERLIVDQDRTTLRFAAMLLNSGNAPALDVVVDAAMFTAGANQDDEIAAFFAHPLGRGDRIREIQPLNNMTFRSEVTIPSSSVRLFDLEGRKLFVPLVGFNALYRWGGKDAQTSESFIVGIDTQSDKMGPFRIDTGPRQFRNIAAGPHSRRVRN